MTEMSSSCGRSASSGPARTTPSVSSPTRAAGRCSACPPRCAPSGSEPSWFGLLLTLTEEAKAAGLTRDDLVVRLEAARIQTRMLFAGNMVRQPCFDAMRAAAEAGRSDAGFRVAGDLAATDRIMDDAFWVGVYPGLSDEMLAYTAAQITTACAATGR
jgi:dTDP-4-amino-4,6-dideoxygalactose transaminase